MTNLVQPLPEGSTTANSNTSFSTLLASSRTLPHSSTPALKRSLRELSRATSHLAGGAFGGGGDPSSFGGGIAAQRLLAQNGHDTAPIRRLSHLTRDWDVTGKRRRNDAPLGDSEQQQPSHDLETFLRGNLDGLVSNIVARERQGVDADVRRLISERTEREYEREKKEMMTELAGYRRVVSPVMDYGHAGNELMPVLKENKTPSTRSGVPSTDASLYGKGSSLSNFVRRHVSIVAALNANPGMSPEDVVSAFETLAASLDDSTSTSKAYVNSWGLLKSQLSSEEGGISNSSSPSPSVVKRRVVGSLAFLCRQFRKHVIDHVRRSSYSIPSNETSDSDFLDDASTYARLLYSSSSPASLWSIIYVCLRSGDASSALKVAKRDSIASHIDPSLLATLTELARHQSSSLSVYDDPSNPPPILQLTTLARRAIDRQEPVFKIAVLSMLSSLPLPSSVATTIEDYVFSRLTATLSSPRPHEEMSRFAADVTGWGRNHFGSGWGYALPLLYAQQYATAVEVLREVGEGEATHLAMAMTHAGMMREALVDPLLVSYAASFQRDDPEAALEYLVRTTDRKQAVVSLVCETKMYSAGAFATLVGTLEQPSRSGALDAHFDKKHVNTILVMAAERANREGSLRDCAEFLVLAEEYGTLIKLFVRELCTCLPVRDNVGEEEKEKRRFWKDAATTFHEKHISQGQTHVIQVLEAEDNLSLGTTFQLVLNLTVFFDRVYEQKFNEASNIISHLRLLPQTESELSQRVESFHSLDVNIKKSFHEIVLAVLELLLHKFTIVKMNGRASSSSMSSSVGIATSGLEQQLEELKREARLIVTFCGLVNVETGLDRIARIEAAMM